MLDQGQGAEMFVCTDAVGQFATAWVGSPIGGRFLKAGLGEIDRLTGSNRRQHRAEISESVRCSAQAVVSNAMRATNRASAPGDRDAPEPRPATLRDEAGEQHEAQHDGETSIENERPLPGIRHREEVISSSPMAHSRTGHFAPSQQQAQDGQPYRQPRRGISNGQS